MRIFLYKLTVLLFVFSNCNQLSAQFIITQIIPSANLSTCFSSVDFMKTVSYTESVSSIGETLKLNLGSDANYVPESISVTSMYNLVSLIAPSFTILESNISDDNVPIFSLSDMVKDDKFIIIQQVSLDCSSFGTASNINIVKATLEGSADKISNSSIQRNNANAEIDITSSEPNGRDGVIGFQFQISNVVENIDVANPCSAHYCAVNNNNANNQIRYGHFFNLYLFPQWKSLV